MDEHTGLCSWSGNQLRFDALRVALGASLMVHFLGQLFTLPALVHDGSLYDAAFIAFIAGLGSPWGATFAELTPPMVTLWIAVCVALAALVMLGVRSRWCAAGLFLLSVEGYWGMYPATLRDDQMVNVVLPWLVLLPSGRTLRLGELLGAGWSRKQWVRWRQQDLPRGSLWVLGLQLLVFQAVVVIIPEYEEGRRLLFFGGACLVVAARWLPWRYAQGLSVLLASALHLAWYWATGLSFTSVALLACTIFLLLARREPRSERLAPADAGVVMVGAVGVMVAFCSLASAARWHRSFSVSARMLADLGVAPPASSVLAREVTSALIESASALPNESLRQQFSLERRSRALLGVVSALSDEALRPLRARVVQPYAQSFCSRYEGFTGSARLFAEARGEMLPVAWWSCSGGSISDVVLLRVQERG